MEDAGWVDTVVNAVTGDLTTTAVIGAIVSLVAGTGIFSFLRRAQTVGPGEATYFSDRNLLSPPMARPAYSDRMAYVLAEMSALAYYPFEGAGGVLRDAAKNFLQLRMKDEKDIEAWLENVADELLIKGVDSQAFFRRIVEAAGFKLMGVVNVAETQGFVCKRDAASEPSYIVVAFRGTEAKVSDWLTDADAVPTIKGDFRMHTGFRKALMVNTDKRGKTALETVRDAINSSEARDASGNRLPLFITGHSLGGALALLTARELAFDVEGACYTYGAPRVANFAYFDGMKTPVFRVVNSVDIVPRVPPGAIMSLVLKLVQFLKWATTLVPPVSRLFKKLEQVVDKLHGYRHHGDQRYLTDVACGNFETVKLVPNPPTVDRLLWMWQHIAASFLAPVKSHGMAVYRKKLQFIANARNRDTQE